MASVGIRELKARLSAHLRRAEAGTRLTVTDRGRAIATIGPATPGADVAWATGLVSERAAHWSGGKPRGLRPRAPIKGDPVSHAVIEDRR